MPTYGFRCPEGHEFDRFYRTMSTAPGEVACPECGKTATRQLHAGAGFVFKGSGFYLTDYGKNAHRGEAPKDATAKGEGSKSETQTEGPTSKSEAAAPKTESSKGESSKSESSKAESPKPESPKPKAES